MHYSLSYEWSFRFTAGIVSAGRRTCHSTERWGLTGSTTAMAQCTGVSPPTRGGAGHGPYWRSPHRQTAMEEPKPLALNAGHGQDKRTKAISEDQHGENRRGRGNGGWIAPSMLNALASPAPNPARLKYPPQTKPEARTGKHQRRKPRADTQTKSKRTRPRKNPQGDPTDKGRGRKRREASDETRSAPAPKGR